MGSVCGLVWSGGRKGQFLRLLFLVHFSASLLAKHNFFCHTQSQSLECSSLLSGNALSFVYAPCPDLALDLVLFLSLSTAPEQLHCSILTVAKKGWPIDTSFVDFGHIDGLGAAPSVRTHVHGQAKHLISNEKKRTDTFFRVSRRSVLKPELREEYERLNDLINHTSTSCIQYLISETPWPVLGSQSSKDRMRIWSPIRS